MAVELRALPRYYSDITKNNYGSLREAIEAELDVEVEHWKKYPQIWTRSIAETCGERAKFVRACIEIQNVLVHYRETEGIIRQCLVAKARTIEPYISGPQHLEILVNMGKLAETHPDDYTKIFCEFMDTFYPGYVKRFSQEFFSPDNGLIGIFGKHEIGDDDRSRIKLPNAPLVKLDQLISVHMNELREIFAHCQYDL